MDLLSFEFYYPVALSCCISFLLSKTKNKLLKYLTPLISLIIIINYTIDNSGMGELGNGFFIMSFGISFLASLIFCISVDGVYKRKKTMIILIVAFALIILSTLSIIMWKQINFSNDLANVQKYLNEKYNTTFKYLSYSPGETCGIFGINCIDGYHPDPELFTFKDKSNKEVHVTKDYYADINEYNGYYNQYKDWGDDYQYDEIKEYIQQHLINLYSKIKYVGNIDTAEYHHFYYNDKNIEVLISKGKNAGEYDHIWSFDFYIPTNLENKDTTLDEVIVKMNYLYDKYKEIQLDAFIYDENYNPLNSDNF
jgi:hypothetical protein